MCHNSRTALCASGPTIPRLGSGSISLSQSPGLPVTSEGAQHGACWEWWSSEFRWVWAWRVLGGGQGSQGCPQKASWPPVSCRNRSSSSSSPRARSRVDRKM